MKRILSAVLALSVLLAAALFCAPQITADSAPALSVTGITVNAGETFTVPVNITDNPGLWSIKYFVYFDPELTLTGIENGNVFLASELYASSNLNRPVVSDANAMRTFSAAGIAPSDYNSSCMFFSKNGAEDETTLSGVLAYYTFTAPSEPGTYFIGVVNCKDGNTINGNDVDVELASVNAVITVEAAAPVAMPGDINGDGLVNVKDIVLLKKFLASTVGVEEIVYANSDVDGDGMVNVKDAVALKAMLASA